MHARDADRHESPRRAADFLDALSLAPTLAPVAADGRDASIIPTVTPSTLTVNPGESGEYTVRVYNTGSNPVTVQLSASEGQTQECGQYSSVIQQIPVPLTRAVTRRRR